MKFKEHLADTALTETWYVYFTIKVSLIVSIGKLELSTLESYQIELHSPLGFQFPQMSSLSESWQKETKTS